jgi:hypothetical protein
VFSQTGAGDLHVLEARDRRPENAAEGRVAVGDVGADDAALLVGVRPQRHHD